MVEVKGRIAPSPTGDLHLGHAFAFLVAWWNARSQGGKIVLRIEDIDGVRVHSSYIKSILYDLQWLGISWDGPPIIQSMRKQTLVNAAFEILELEKAYPCVCSRRDLSRDAAQLLSNNPSENNVSSAPQQGVREIPYPGTCKDKFLDVKSAEKHSRAEAGIRLKTPEGWVEFNDLNYGVQKIDVKNQVGDFLILRRNKTPAYQLAIVVDDQMDQVTEVVRGRDLIDSTARQILVAEAFNYSIPAYLHLPLICDQDGKRLAKRDDALSLERLRSQGVTKEAIVAWAARSAGQVTPGEEISASKVLQSYQRTLLPREDIILPENSFSLFE